MARFFKNKEEETIEELEEKVRRRKQETDLPPLPSRKEQTQYIEREVNLSLVNDKLNYIISLLEGK